MKHILPFFFTTFVLTLPLLISAFSAQTANLINSILTGRYSYVDLAAVSYGFLMVMSIGCISQGGIGALLPDLQKKINDPLYCHTSVYSNIIALLGYVMISLFIFSVFYILTFYLEVTDDYQQTIRLYLLPMIVFLIALQILSFAVNVLIITEKIKIIAMFGLCATGLDIVVSSILVHGITMDQITYIQPMGAQGAAFGSMFGSLCVTFLACSYLHKTQSFQLKLSAKMFEFIYFKQAFCLIKMSLPAGIASLFSWGLMFVLTLCLTLTIKAEVNIAANQILLVLSGLLLVFIKVSASIMVSHLSKRADQSLSNKLFMFQHLIGYPIFYIVLLGLMVLNFEKLIVLITQEQAVISILVATQLLLVIYVLLHCVDNIVSNYLVSKQMNTLILNTQLISCIVFFIYLGGMYLFSSWTLKSLWIGLLIERSVLLLLKIFHLKKDQLFSWSFLH